MQTAANENGGLTSSQRYPTKCVGLCRPFGEARDAGQAGTPYRYTGQREMLAGLYDYRARWYEPALGRFLQPDSLIPQPGNPQDWDRYSYVRNSPVRYVDPSGHRECETTESGNCGFMAPRTMSVVTWLLGDYGVTLTGDWSVSEGFSAYVATYKTGKALRSYTNSGGAYAFRAGFGNIEYHHSFDLGGWYGIGDDGKISVLDGVITPRLIVHELGHAFEKNIWNRDGGKYSGTKNPIQMLIDDGVHIGDTLITGEGNRNNDMNAPDNGYWSDNMPDQYHPRVMEDGDNTNEDWADMFMNWVFDSFYPNPAGTALGNWISINMTEWIR